MTDLEPNHKGIDHLLRRSMAAPLPTLAPGFDQRVIRQATKHAQPLDRQRRILLIGYGLISVVVCAVLMRGQGLDWAPVSGMIAAPLLLLAGANLLWSRTRQKPAAASN